MIIYFSTDKDSAEKYRKEGFMVKGLTFTSDYSYAKQRAKAFENPVVCTIEITKNLFEKTKAKKPTYKNVIRFSTFFKTEEL